MKIIVIGYHHPSIDVLESEFVNLSHTVNRIDLYVSHKTGDLKRESSQKKLFELRNFHDLTIEIVEFEPDLIVYRPISSLQILEDNSNEIIEIIYQELIEHILETAKMVNSKFCYLNPLNSEMKLVQNGLNLVKAYSKSVVVDDDLSKIDIQMILEN